MRTTQTSAQTSAPDRGVTENVVYVGVDGSDAASAAARWAADNALRRGAALCLVHGYVLTVRAFAGEVVYPIEIYEGGRNWQQDMLARAAESLADTHPGLEVRTLLRDGSGVQVLERAAEGGLATVVGAHGRHQFIDAVLGSTAAGMIAHASGPVVVVRNDPATGEVRTEGPVIVGLDGFAGSNAALGFAFEEADLRGCELIAVHSWDDSVINNLAYAFPEAIDASLIDAEETRLLAGQLAGWVDRYPGVQVDPVVLRGAPAATLLRCADQRAASLLVVGSRGRGGFLGLLLGSTSQALASHASCPVAVVRGTQ